jgi:hypothetical protein
VSFRRALEMALAAPWLAAVGQPVPDTPHAVSVSLPSWKANVGYEEGEDWVLSKLKTGYPRFFIHLTIQELQNEILSKHGKSGEGAMLFPSTRTAKICYDFLLEHATGYTEKDFRILELAPSAFAIKQAVETQTTKFGSTPVTVSPADVLSSVSRRFMMVSSNPPTQQRIKTLLDHT